MQRDRANLSSLRFTAFCVLLVAYEIASAATQFLPPLIGVMFAYLVIQKATLDRDLDELSAREYLGFGFLVFAELLHGFMLFSCALAFLVFYYFIYDWLIVNFKYRQLLLGVFVFAGYAGALIVSDLILYVMNEAHLSLNYRYLAFALVESVLATALFKDKIL